MKEMGHEFSNEIACLVERPRQRMSSTGQLDHITFLKTPDIPLMLSSNIDVNH